MEFSLSTIQKLSSPAMDDEMQSSNHNIMEELAEMCSGSDCSKYAHVIALVKGLRYVLEKIQVCLCSGKDLDELGIFFPFILVER